MAVRRRPLRVLPFIIDKNFQGGPRSYEQWNLSALQNSACRSVVCLRFLGCGTVSTRSAAAGPDGAISTGQ
jgi:hypothetical protein